MTGRMNGRHGGRFRQGSRTGSKSTTTKSSTSKPSEQKMLNDYKQGLQVHKSGTIHTHSYVQTNKHMYDWIHLNTCSLIDLFSNQSFVCNVHKVNTTLSLAMNAETMMTNF